MNTVRIATSTSLNSGPRQRGNEGEPAIAGRNPARSISTPNSTSAKGSMTSALSDQLPWNALAAAHRLYGHDDAEQHQQPAEHRREIARAHPQRRAEWIVVRHQHCADADRDQHQAGPEIPVVHDPQRRSLRHCPPSEAVPTTRLHGKAGASSPLQPGRPITQWSYSALMLASLTTFSHFVISVSM